MPVITNDGVLYVEMIVERSWQWFSRAHLAGKGVCREDRSPEALVPSTVFLVALLVIKRQVILKPTAHLTVAE